MRAPRPSVAATAVLAGALVVGCGQPAPSTAPSTTVPRTAATAPAASPSQPPASSQGRQPAGTARVVRTVATRIETPWGITFLPSGKALVGSRDTARVYRVRPAGGRTLVGTVPGVVSNGASGGEAGLLGLAASPAFRTDHRVYAYFSSGSDNRIAWMTYRRGRLGAPHVILRGIPRGLHHNGGGLAFGPDGMLYASTGESGSPALAQSRRSLGGKVLRMTPRGTVPRSGNPFRGSLVYSYGHRNVEGIAFDSAGRLWASEFGDKAYDELNLIRPGRNYGWPATQGRTTDPRYVSPKKVWRTPVGGPSGIAIVGGNAWIGALTGQRLYRVHLSGSHAGGKSAFFVGRYGRIRAVHAAPGGRIWISTSNTDGRGAPRQGDDRLLVVRVA